MIDLFVQGREALASLNPAAPWLALTLACFLGTWVMRRWAPVPWAIIAKWGPEGSTIEHVTQAIPSVAFAAFVAALGTGLDPWMAAAGALAGLFAPLLNHAAKAYRRSPVPEVDGPTSRRLLAAAVLGAAAPEVTPEPEPPDALTAVVRLNGAMVELPSWVTYNQIVKAAEMTGHPSMTLSSPHGDRIIKPDDFVNLHDGDKISVAHTGDA